MDAIVLVADEMTKQGITVDALPFPQMTEAHHSSVNAMWLLLPEQYRSLPFSSISLLDYTSVLYDLIPLVDLLHSSSVCICVDGVDSDVPLYKCAVCSSEHFTVDFLDDPRYYAERLPGSQAYWPDIFLDDKEDIRLVPEKQKVVWEHNGQLLLALSRVYRFIAGLR